jgi:hypothetical protein
MKNELKAYSELSLSYFLIKNGKNAKEEFKHFSR